MAADTSMLRKIRIIYTPSSLCGTYCSIEAVYLLELLAYRIYHPQSGGLGLSSKEDSACFVTFSTRETIEDRFNPQGEMMSRIS